MSNKLCLKLGLSQPILKTNTDYNFQKDLFLCIYVFVCVLCLYFVCFFCVFCIFTMHALDCICDIFLNACMFLCIKYYTYVIQTLLNWDGKTLVSTWVCVACTAYTVSDKKTLAVFGCTWHKVTTNAHKEKPIILNSLMLSILARVQFCNFWGCGYTTVALQLQQTIANSNGYIHYKVIK